MKKKILAVAFFISFLIACSSNKNGDIHNEIWMKNKNGFNILVEQFANNIENIWGFKEVLIADQKNYIKYTDNYQTRIHIDFDKGAIIVETIAKKKPTAHLRQAIIRTLLMDDNLSSIEELRFNDKNVQIFKEPFLFGQITDQNNQPIRWKERAVRFTSYLLNTRLKKRSDGIRIIYSITINLVPNHFDKRASKYMNIVQKASKKYGIDASLILAIMKIESSFNPYAISHSDAIGLMQVIQHSAGKDVFRTQSKSGTPSRNYLFNPVSNIDIGTAYLALLKKVYLNRINNPISRRYAMIAAYNSGAGSVLRVFSNDKVQAISIINNMSPDEVYTMLINRHPSVESRRYLHKVNIAQKDFIPSLKEG